MSKDLNFLIKRFLDHQTISFQTFALPKPLKLSKKPNPQEPKNIFVSSHFLKKMATLTSPTFVLTTNMLKKITPCKLINFTTFMANAEDMVLAWEIIDYPKNTNL